jgi:predicted N-acetyltransferase YhbS
VGTFGPVGVASESRKAGLGAALTRAALDDLAARGHRTATIPWVDPGRVAFYRGLVTDLRVRECAILSKR